MHQVSFLFNRKTEMSGEQKQDGSNDDVVVESIEDVDELEMQEPSTAHDKLNTPITTEYDGAKVYIRTCNILNDSLWI